MTVSSLNPEEFGTLFLNEEFETIYRCTSKEFQQLLSLEQFIDVATAHNTNVKHYHLEHQTSIQMLHQYIWLDDRKEKAIHVSFDKHRQIQSLYLTPFITYPESNQRFTRNMYRMPIKGEWLVFWGGTNELINYHYAYESQRYAYDLVKVKDGLTFQDTQLRNENFYAFNEDIVAPADGKVVKIVEGLSDNVPFEMDAKNPAGNYVVIQHAKDEYSLLAHLKKNSAKVQVGQLVEEGQLIGKCGNSGNSSEPHLHFQIMDSSDFETGKSLRIRFKDYSEPIQGDTVMNAQRYKKQTTGDKVETAISIGELLLLIPRAIAKLFN